MDNKPDMTIENINKSFSSMRIRLALAQREFVLIY